jgi:hypothetical protein
LASGRSTRVNEQVGTCIVDWRRPVVAITME